MTSRTMKRGTMRRRSALVTAAVVVGMVTAALSPLLAAEPAAR